MATYPSDLHTVPISGAPANPVRVSLPGDQSGYGGSFAQSNSGFSAPTITIPTLSVIPSGASAAVTVTAADLAAIMSAISAQLISKQTTMISKQAAVNALTSIAAVIAYDATIGW